MIDRSTEESPRISTRDKILHSAATLFLERGYEKTTIRDIAEHAGVNRGSVVFAFRNKEAILEMLTAYVLEGQFETVARFLEGKTNDPVFFYGAETVMQLYMAESSEQVRELYAVAYAYSSTADMICRMVTTKLEMIFKPYNPDWKAKDFFEREIASGGIIRAYMAAPCDMYFTMERKVRAFLETALLIYHVPAEKIAQTVSFVSQFDFAALAKDTIDNLLDYLDSRI